MECVSLNVSIITHMPFVQSSNVLSWNPVAGDPGFNIDTNIVKFPSINTSKFTSDQLVKCADIPEAVAVQYDHNVHYQDEICCDRLQQHRLANLLMARINISIAF